MFLRLGVINSKPWVSSWSNSGLRDVAFVSEELAKQGLSQVWQRLAIIHVAWGQPAIQYFTQVIDDQMELEAVKPAHRGLAPGG